MLSWVAMDIAQMWHFYEEEPLSLSLWDKMCFFLSLGQDVFFSFFGTRCVFSSGIVTPG